MKETDKTAPNQRTPSRFEMEELEADLLAGINLNDPRDKYAWQEWRKDAEKIRTAVSDAEFVHFFQSKEVRQALVAYFKADLEENKRIFDIKAARNARKLAKIQLVNAVGEYDGRFIDEDEDEQIVPECGAVIARTKSVKVRLYQKVIDGALSMAASPEQKDTPVTFPEALGDGIREFKGDLEEFLKVNGDAGCEVVARVCQEQDFAKEVSNDDDMPKCLKFLAGLVAEVNGKNRLPEKPGQVGFSFAGK